MARIIVPIQLTSQTQKTLGTLTEKQGMTQVALISRLVEWFAKQPQAIRSAAMSLDPAASKATASLIVKQMASAKNE